ncbi:DUF1361 domain-containing protein [Paenibacillus peoriae]|uniref:DUF1361 domain-containing protein n=1 Tax=Paenibacillus peoriae TaxID=59893 RepID=UPI00026C6262|nr:DUF1361 domain-containing protein [Paenibacillus peoriae]MEC0182281.1 DUF1361 domain-containing protein [Paenibacillus peoriae]
MYARLRSLNYPVKGYVFIVLAVCSVISTLWIINVQLPSGGRPYFFIWWNMMLAWIPMILTLLLDVIHCSWRRGTRTFLLWVTGAAWLLFYPNTPYLITDLLHVFANYPFLEEPRFWGNPYFWNHVLGMLLVAVLGLTMGFVSLESIRQLVQRARGGLVSWLFVVAVLLLSSLGIYIGRFFRGNTWDIVSAPSQLYEQVSSIWADSLQRAHFIEFTGLVFVILLVSYMSTMCIIWMGNSCRNEWRNW